MRHNYCFLGLYIILVVFVIGCSNNENTVSDIYPYNEYYVDTFEREKIISEPGLINGVVVPNSETAVQFASIIYNNITKDSNQTFEPTAVWYYKDSAVWVVVFSEKSNLDDYAKTGECFSVAISESDGQVLAMWAGE